VANALVAVRVLEACEAAGITIGPDAIVAGLREARWPARLEWLGIGTRRLLIDAAHNPAGARALAEYVQASGEAPLPIVLAIMQDKDVNGMLQAILPVASAIVATETPSARAMPATALAAAIADLDPRMLVSTESDPDAAVQRALETAGAAVAAGSIYLIGPLRARLIAAGARPE
jgi:dihydrofolate synthase/folylpolyglutamate synthase